MKRCHGPGGRGGLWPSEFFRIHTVPLKTSARTRTYGPFAGRPARQTIPVMLPGAAIRCPSRDTTSFRIPDKSRGRTAPRNAG